MPSVCDPNLVNPEVTDSAGNVVGAICYEANGKNGKPAGDPGPDGVPDGFPDPVHIYKAVEIELNKRFSANWQLLSNWRIPSVRGNLAKERVKNVQTSGKTSGFPISIS